MAIWPSSTQSILSQKETFRRTRVSKSRSSSESSAIRILYFSSDMIPRLTGTGRLKQCSSEEQQSRGGHQRKAGVCLIELHRGKFVRTPRAKSVLVQARGF